PPDHEYYLVLGGLRRDLVEAIPGVGPHLHKPGCLASGFPDCQEPPVDTTPNEYLINGHSYPDTEQQMQTPSLRGTLVQVKEGETIRLRILNAGQTFEALHLHGHDMEVVAEDGTPLASPYWVDTLTVGPAERFDVVVKANNPGLWMLHSHVANHETNDFQSRGGMDTMMVYDGYLDKMGQFNATSELPAGLPYNGYARTPQAIPATIYVSHPYGPITTASSAANPPVVAHMAFPVVLPCAVESISVSVHAQAATAQEERLNGPFQVDVILPNGDSLPTIADGHSIPPIPAGQTDANWTLAPEKVGSINTPYSMSGVYNVTVSGGQVVDTQITISAVVQYYNTFAQATQSARNNKYGDCTVVPLT
ncbi:MAG: multicopper oxidase domain-containing protein, partial [Thermoplasmatota archaeon]